MYIFKKIGECSEKFSGYSRNGKLGRLARYLIKFNEQGYLEQFCINSGKITYEEALVFIKISKSIIDENNFEILDDAIYFDNEIEECNKLINELICI